MIRVSRDSGRGMVDRWMDGGKGSTTHDMTAFDSTQLNLKFAILE